MKHIAQVLKQHLPSDFKQSCGLILDIIETLEKRKITKSSLEFMFFTEYIEKFGIENFESSITTMERVTQFTS